MIKRICDRCGMVCKDNIKEGSKEHNGVALARILPRSEAEFGYKEDDVMSLCPYCMEKLEKWLNEGENREID